MNTLTFRPATPEDLPTLLEFEQGIVVAERPMNPTIKDKDVSYYDIAALIEQPDAEVVVGTIDGEIVTHVMGFKRFGKLPIPEFVGTNRASNHDLEVFKPFWERLWNRAVFGDKAYGNKDWEIWLAQNRNVHIYTPVKKKKGQKELSPFQELYSTAVSQVRQPIESFFNWIIEKVGIQKASKVRSPEGLFVHVYGRFAAAMMAMAFDIF